MKTLNLILLISILSIGFLPEVKAQDSKYSTTEFHVDGVCDQCKARIENAAYIKGVKHCEWNKETEMLSLVYNPKKTDLNKVHQSIANAGHTTEKVKADPEAYAKLPACCAYESGMHKH